MFAYEHSISVQVSTETIWGLYTDVKAWNCWDESLESARCVGGLTPGAEGVMALKDGMKLPFTIVECEKPVKFTARACLGAVTVNFGHLLQNSGDDTKITHTVTVEGDDEKMLEGIGRGISAGIPQSMQRLARLGEKNEAV